MHGLKEMEWPIVLTVAVFISALFVIGLKPMEWLFILIVAAFISVLYAIIRDSRPARK